MLTYCGSRLLDQKFTRKMIKFFTLLVIISIQGLPVTGYKTYRGYKLLRLTINTRGKMMWLEKLEEKNQQIDVWSHPSKQFPHSDVLVSPHFFKKFKTLLHQRRIHFVVTRNSIKNLIKEQHNSVKGRIKRSIDAIAQEQFSEKNFKVNQYHSYANVVDWMENIADDYPDIAQIFNMSKTFEGRDLVGIKLGSNSTTPKPSLWIDSGIHAREWIAPATSIYIIHSLISQYGNDSTVTQLMDKYDWYIVPIANPDGYEYSINERRLWRKTRSIHRNDSKCIGVDANRNWGFHWGEVGSSTYPCSNIYPGPYAFSELETQALSKFLGQIPRLQMYMSLHSFGQIWLGPWGYTSTKPANFNEQKTGALLALNALKRKYNTKYVYGSISDLMYAASGTSIDYMQNKSIPYIYGVELRPEDGRHTYGFLFPARFIKPTGEEMLAALKALARHIIDVKRL